MMPLMPATAAETGATAHRDWTVLEVLSWMTGRFTELKLDSPRLDAELLLAHALSGTRIEVYTRSTDLLDADALGRIRELVKRRQGGEPVAYITGRREFWGLALAVDRRVLVPRPDTETVIEAAQDRFAECFADRPGRILDVGTGSGALALALARLRPQATVVATDISEDSLAVAKENATRLGLPVQFCSGDLLAAIGDHAPFDLIVANLPYIPSADLATLPREVQQEPRRALDGGADGLHLVRQLVAQVPPYLQPGGAVVLEIGAGQADATAELLVQAGLQDVRIARDLGGIDRVVSARRA